MVLYHGSFVFLYYAGELRGYVKTAVCFYYTLQRNTHKQSRHKSQAKSRSYPFDLMVKWVTSSFLFVSLPKLFCDLNFMYSGLGLIFAAIHLFSNLFKALQEFFYLRRVIRETILIKYIYRICENRFCIRKVIGDVEQLSKSAVWLNIVV